MCAIVLIICIVDSIIFDSDEPAKPERVLPVPIQHYEGNCVMHTTWNNPNHNDVTQYEIFANGTRMSADTAVINTANGTISALFSISCAAYEISVSALNACGQTLAVSNLTPQTPLHSIPEPEPATRSTNSNDGKYKFNYSYQFQVLD